MSQDKNIILNGVVGSRAYGLHTEFSDYDYRGIFIQDPIEYLSLRPKSDFKKVDGDDVTLFELGKFVNLALNANPNVLELLYLKEYEYINDVGKNLIRLRKDMLSTKIWDSYGGYAVGQFHRFESGIRRSAANWKNAMHLIRLMYCGIHALKYGEVLVDMSERREELLNIRKEQESHIDSFLYK